ncbi:MAG: LuxR C-terminal-related transcriptional regulator [Chloroflexota bacterium]
MTTLQSLTCRNALQYLCSTTSDALCIIDEAGIIRSVNHASENIFGYRQEQVIGQSLTVLVPAFDTSLLRDDDHTSLTHMVTGVHETGNTFAGEMFISTFMIEEMPYHLVILRDLSSHVIAVDTVDLSPRQQQVLKLVVEGYTSREIAEQLIISIKTVETHRANIMQKFGVRNVSSLVRAALEMAIV